MRYTTRSSLLALVIGAALFTACNAHAQVQMFDNVPSVEQLRTILAPETSSSASRSIVITRPSVKSSVGQPASLTATEPASATSPAPATETPAASPAQVPVPKAAMRQPRPEKKIAKEGEDTTAVGFRINFAFNSATIPAESMPYLDAIAKLLHEEQQLVLSVEGHTDAVGNTGYNLELSNRRAVSVANYLTEHGVTKEQLMPIGKGKSEPLVADPYDGRNRRVQFSRIVFEGASS